MKIGMIFPGYGSQFVGMAKDVYDESRVMQEYFEQASHCLDANFIKLCFASSDLELSKMHNAYTSLFLVSSALSAVLAEAGIKPAIVAGYNVGQFAAMHAANGLTFADGLYILNKFAKFAQEALEQETCAMARIKGCSTEELQLLIKQVAQDQVSIAVHEMPNQHIIAGSQDAVFACMQHAKTLPDVKVKEVPVKFGMHTAIMQSAVEQFAMYLEKVDFKDIEIPLLSNLNAHMVQSGISLKHEALHQFTKPMHWLSSLQELHTCDLLLSVGPGTMLVDMAQQLYPHKKVMAIQKLADIEALKNYIAEQQPVDEQADDAVVAKQQTTETEQNVG